MWGLYEEWHRGFMEKAQEDWITFRYRNIFLNFFLLIFKIFTFSIIVIFTLSLKRSKTYVFEEFLFSWQDRLRKLQQPTAMSVKLQAEVDKYKVDCRCQRGVGEDK